MPSPFPGMNPYLEQEDVWHDFHERFMPAAADALASQVDPAYFVRIDEHVFIHEAPDDSGRLVGRADLAVPRTSATAILEAPAEVTMALADEESVSYLVVRDRRDRRVITVIELLSPSNKQPGTTRDQYLAKRAEFLSSGVHFVEIDLLRGGRRMPWKGLSPCDYCVVVSRAERRPQAGVWPIQLADRLPEIPVPLRAPDPDAKLDLQQLLDRIYDSARYGSTIYQGTPQPALTPTQTEWARRVMP